MTSKPTSNSALGVTFKLLRARDHFRAEIESKLRAKRFTEVEIAQALADAERRGYVNDVRLATRLAQRLQAEKLWSAQRIRDHLVSKGCAGEDADAACLGLEPDGNTARRLLKEEMSRAAKGDARRDLLRRASRRLASAGFDPETIESVLSDFEVL